MDWAFLTEWLRHTGLNPEQIYTAIRERMDRVPWRPQPYEPQQLTFPFWN